MTICQSCGAGVRKRIRCRHKPCGMMVCDYCLHESHQKHMLGAPVYPESGGVSDVRCIELSERMNTRTVPAEVHVTCCACVTSTCGNTGIDETPTRH